MSCNLKISLALIVSCCLAASAPAIASANDYVPHLTDCASFFGLLSQAPIKDSIGFRTMVASFSTYAVEVVPRTELDAELEKSKRRISTLVTDAKLKNDQGEIAKQADTCFAILKKAEVELWPKLPELSKLLTPRIFVTE